MDKKMYDYKVNEELELLALIKATAERETKTGNPFLTITFQDTTRASCLCKRKTRRI